VLVVIVVVVVFVAAIVVMLVASQPITVRVDGRSVTVPRGTTVGNLAARGLLDSRPGRLLSVRGLVIKEQGGAPPLVWRNGRQAGYSQPVFDGDVLASAPGVDAVEPRTTLKEPIPYKTRFEGKGPILRLANPGSVGVREKVIGAISKSQISSRTVVPEQDMVVKLLRPTPKDKLIALTFDDGPWPGQTEKILAILRHEGVHATFFMLGVRIKITPQLAKQVAEDGNLIGDHTYGHRDLTKQTVKVVKSQIVGGMTWIQRAAGVRATWFRPPYGAIDQKVWKETRKLGLRVALWDVDTRDWARPGVKQIIKTADTYTRPGSIILMHDGGGNRAQTIKALPTIIRDLKSRGFIFVTLDQLDAAK
jgi:peptidoglycan/xylan/chitin deacetylase (PgdA/CDA1 family)